jgi:hypothetical protein
MASPNNSLVPMLDRVLIVAPSLAGINQTPEIDTIGELGYRVRLLQGDVDDQRLYRTVQEGRYDIVHIMTHGSLDELAVSSGRLTRNAVLQVVRLSGARIVFLNACNSIKLGQTLVNGGLAVCIASVQEVEDAAAWQTAITFYTALAQDGDVSRAYKAACAGGDVQYAFLTDGVYAALAVQPVISEIKLLGLSIKESQSDRKQMHDEIRRLARIVTACTVATASSLIWLAIHTLLAMPR